MRQFHGLRRSAALLGVLLLLGTGCERANRYTSVRTTAARPAAEPKKAEPLPQHYAWLEPSPVPDIPIVFIDSVSQPEGWHKLPDYWNHFPPPYAGSRIAHVGMSPLGAVVGLLAADQLEVIKIKVPLGLPDPTPQIPPANPPTYAKWRLGKRLFFDTALLDVREGGGSCASCHQPKEGFTQLKTPALHSLMPDTLSLLNCVYNKSQFWDGRVAALEEVIQRGLEDERPSKDVADKEGPQYPHVWSGIIERLLKSAPGRPSYREEFQRVFGISQPTQDAVGKALATYMRTILSGNSLYDRVLQATGKSDDQLLTAKDVEPLLEDADGRARLGRPNVPKDEVAGELAKGHRLFHGRAGCAACHPGWNFTDNSFHNVGIRESDFMKGGGLPGRFRHQSVGLKESRMIGAFRTPTLRNLPRTAPYFHDPYFQAKGAYKLAEVVEYFNSGVDAAFNAHLDPLLLAGPGTPKRLNLHADEVRALVLFLNALDGDPVPAVIAGRKN